MRAKRTDANHAKVRDTLRAHAYVVHDLANLGIPVDLGVESPYGGFPLFIEVKDGMKPPSARKLTDLAQKWAELTKDQTRVVLSPTEAVLVCEEYFHAHRSYLVEKCYPAGCFEADSR
jgi:hypothetical protein